MAFKVGKGKVGAGTAIGAAVGGPVGAAIGAAYDNRGGLKQIGKQIGGWNPYSKVTTNVPQADQSALQKIEAPKPFEQAGFSQAVINTAPQNEFRQGQSEVAAMLQKQAMGQGPSVVQQQSDRDRAAALAASRSALASVRGGANPLAARAALMGNQQTALQMSEQAQVNRLAEQQQAQQAYGQVAGQARAQDLQLAQAQAEQQNQFNNLRQQYANQGMSAAEANQRAALDYERIRLGQGTAQAQADAESKRAQKSMIGGLINQGAGAAMTAFGKPSGA